MKASYVLELIDDFTNQMITENQFKVHFQGGNQPVWKDGFFVFINLLPENYEVTIQSRLYQPVQITFEITEESGLQSLQKIRLQPDISYPRKENAIVLFGKNAGIGKVYAYSLETAPLKLVKEYQGEDTISIRHMEGKDLSGKQFRIKNREHSETFRLLNAVEEEGMEYKLLKPLLHAYKKTDSEIYPVYETNADRDGAFFFLFAGNKSSREKINSYTFTVWQEAEQEKQMVITEKKTNYFDFESGR